jgi:type III secretion protein L
MSKVIKRNEFDSTGLPEAPLSITSQEQDDLSGTPRKRVVDKEVYDAKTQAQQIIEHAEAQAAQIAAKAKQDGDAARATARTEGFTQGKNEALAKLKELTEKQTAQFLEVSSKHSQQYEELLAQIEPQVVQLTMTIVRRVLGEQVQVNPQIVVEITKNALRSVRQRREINIRAHPEDVAILKENRRQLLDVLLRTKDVALEEDSGILRGGVIIETEAGRIDARLETQMEAFDKVLKP